MEKSNFYFSNPTCKKKFTNPEEKNTYLITVESDNKVYLVTVTSREMGRLRISQEISFKRGGILSQEYFLLGNSRCGFFNSVKTGKITGK